MVVGQLLLIRADASAQIGTGHVMRCLALAQAWQDAGGQTCFVLANPAPSLESRLQAEGMVIRHLVGIDAGTAEDAEATAVIAHEKQADWIIIDGYQFGAEYQQQLKTAGFRLLFIDDYGHAAHYYADIVLNQNIYAHADLYPNREPYTQLLLGTQYALLRREFWPWRQWQRPTPDKARNILVTLGGSDPDNMTLTVIQALQLLPDDDWEAVVLVGGQNPHYQTLETAVANYPRIQLRHNVTNMPELMAWADIAISAGGSTSWELCFMGLPTMVIVLAENQMMSANELATIGIMQLLARLEPSSISQSVINLCMNTEQRSCMNGKSRDLVKGDGCFGVAQVMNKIIGGNISNE